MPPVLFAITSDRLVSVIRRIALVLEHLTYDALRLCDGDMIDANGSKVGSWRVR